MRLLVYVTAMLLLVVSELFAQIPTISRHVGKERHFYKEPLSPLVTLNAHEKAGDWSRFQALAYELLKTMADENPKLKALLGNVERNYFNIVWEAAGADGKPVVKRVLVHRGLLPHHASRLPGLERSWPKSAASSESEAPQPLVDGVGPEVLDVLLTPATEARLTSSYLFTPVADPLTTQLPDVLAKLNPLGFLARAAGVTDEAPSLLVYVNQPDLAMARADIAIKDAISTLVATSELKASAKETLASVSLRQARTSPCALKLAAEMAARIGKAADDEVCKNGGAACGRLVKSAVDGAFDTTVAACAPEQPSVGFDPVLATEEEFRKLVVAGGAKVVSGEFKLLNRPLTRFSYGLMSGLILGHPSLDKARVKVDGGKLVKAPVDRVATMVVLNIHPSRYDSEWPKISRAERLRFFAGGVMTPDFGFTAGAGFGIVRGLTLNLGGMLFFPDTLKEGEVLGEAPKDSNDPFETGRAIAGFVGLSYTFK